MQRTASEKRHGTLRNGERRRNLQRRLIARDGMRCCWCDCEMVFPDGKMYPPNQLTIEHVVPRSSGGTNNIGNLKLACRRCNNSRQGKGTKRIYETQV